MYVLAETLHYFFYMAAQMKYTIVIATYNAESLLERAILSILTQSYPNYEILIQDGGSTDGTLDIAKKYPDSRIKLESAADTGIYDAWNKAVARATGDWVMFLGSDDFLADKDSLAKCHLYIKRLPKEILFAYGAMLKGRNMQVEWTENRSLKDVYKVFCYDMGLPFTAAFVRMALVKQYKFDTSYKIAGDFEFAARFVTHRNIARIPVLVSYMERNGISDRKDMQCLRFDERGKVLKQYILPKAQEIMLGCFEYSWNDDHSLI